MIAVTPEYQSAVYASSRQTKAKIVFEILDTTALGDATPTVTSEAIISRTEQLFNEVRETTTKYATLEQDYWKMDGSFALPPRPVETSYEVGWWSDELSDNSSEFVTPQELQIDFSTTHDSIGLTIFFDTLAEEYAVDFVITVYDALDVVLHEETVVGNDSASYILAENLLAYKKILISITKWSKPIRRVRMLDISFGIVETYAGSEIINMSVLEEVDPTSSIITSNELKFMLDNQDKRFNLLNPTGVYPYLQRRQQLNTFIGVVKADTSVEYIPMGIYYLTDWTSDEGALTASFTARDVLDLLSQSTFRKGIVQSDNLYDLAVDVLTDAGIDAADYTIDTALQSITVAGYIPICKHREALQMIATASQAVVYSDREGKIIIKQLDVTSTGELIDFDNVYKSPQIKLDKLVNTITIQINNYTSKASSEEIYRGVVNIVGTLDVWIEYKSAPCNTVTATASGGTLNSATYYDNAALLNITASGNVTIVANGKVYEKSSTVYQLVDSEAPAGEETLELKMDNALITSSAIATDVADWLLAEYKKRFLYEVNWRQNPALESGDIVTIEDDYGQNYEVRIVRNEFQFAGMLNGKTNGKSGGA